MGPFLKETKTESRNVNKAANLKVIKSTGSGASGGWSQNYLSVCFLYLGDHGR